ncbi:MAG: ATP synthase F1 subunit epsilon [Bacteroidales bacterium]
MEVSITTPDKLIYQGEAQLVQFPGFDGSFAIMENHAPLISVLKKGEVRIVESKNQNEVFVPIGGGVVEVSKNKIVLLAQ